MPHTEPRETKNTKNIRIETLAILGGSSSLAAPVSLLASRVCFNPFVEPLQPGRNKTRPCSAHRPKYFPNSNKVPRCIIYRRTRLYNKFLSYTRPESSCPHFVVRLNNPVENCLYIHTSAISTHMRSFFYTYDIFNTKFMSQRDALSRDFFQTTSK